MKKSSIGIHSNPSKSPFPIGFGSGDIYWVNTKVIDDNKMKLFMIR